MFKALKGILKFTKVTPLPNVNGLEPIEVLGLPKDIYIKFDELNCTKQNNCFANCVDIVNNHSLAEKYVLCIVEDVNGEKHAHAIIKNNGKYYDPTLNNQLNRASRDWLHSDFSKAELKIFVKKWYGVKVFSSSEKIDIYPPALLKSGKVACVEVTFRRS